MKGCKGFLTCIQDKIVFPTGILVGVSKDIRGLDGRVGFRVGMPVFLGVTELSIVRRLSLE